MILFEVVILGGVVAFCIWELVSLRRDRLRMEREAEREEKTELSG
ncbi:hypothetical protein [Afifella pfennigii]|nr:hypothetical protein [Afifella pfennigii]